MADSNQSKGSPSKAAVQKRIVPKLDNVAPEIEAKANQAQDDNSKAEKPQEQDAVTSKKGQKKAAKELEKQRQKQEKQAKAQKEREAKQQSEQANNFSKGNYGPQNPSELGDDWSYFSRAVDFEGESRTFRCVVGNVRGSSAKLVFFELYQTLDDRPLPGDPSKSLRLVPGYTSIQAVGSVVGDTAVSSLMIKFLTGLAPEDLVSVTGIIKATNEEVKSTSIKTHELHIQKLFLVAGLNIPKELNNSLPLQVKDCNLAVPSEEEPSAEKKVEPNTQAKLETLPAGAVAERAIPRLDSRLKYRTIDLRSDLNHCIFMIKDGIRFLFQDFLRQRAFIGIETPKILGGASESGAEVFKFRYFKKEACLAQSPQFYKQMMIQSRFPRVYEIGPVFRAENSNTSQHLTEFTGLDLEMEFNKDYHEVVTLLEELVVYIFGELQKRYARESTFVLNAYNVQPLKVPTKVPRLTYSEGVAMLAETKFPVEPLADLNKDQEKELGKLVRKKYDSDFYTLDKFPAQARPFYSMPDAKNKDFANAYDMFVRGQEVLSGAQRIHTYDQLAQQLRGRGLDPEAPGIKDYVDGFRYGCAPHAGGGFGLERLVQFYLGMGNIRQASLFPRDPDRLEP